MRRLEFVGEDCESGYVQPEPHPKLPIRSRKRGGLTSHLANCGLIVRLHGQSLRENEYRAGHRAIHLIDGVDYSLLSFPLKNRKGQLLGLVKVQNKKDSNGKPGTQAKFTNTDVSLAVFLSTRLVVALQGKELVSFFKSLSAWQSDPGQLSSFESTTVARAADLVGADQGSLALWDESKRALIITAQVGGDGKRIRTRVPRRSVIQTVWNRRESICIADVRQYQGPYFAFDPKTRSKVAVLLATRDASAHLRLIGVLSVDSYTKDNFDTQDQEMLEGVADALAAAIISARPETSIRHALASLSAPARVYAEPKKLLVSILERVRETYGFDRGLIYVAEEMSNLLRLGAQMGDHHHEQLVGRYTHGANMDSLAVRVWKSGEPLYSERPREDSRVSQDGLDVFGIEGPLLGFPLVHSGKTVGVLIGWSSDGPKPRFEHQQQLAPFAQLAAAEIAISYAYGLLDEWIHNIAQPTQNVRGLVDVILRNNQQQSNKLRFLATLGAEIGHLVAVVERSRLMRQHQRLAPVVEEYCLRQVVESMYHAFLRRAYEKGINLQLVLPEVRECLNYGDENRVSIALDEVVNNALNHTDQGRVKIELMEVDEWFKISVTDDGDGVPEAYTKEIFRPYFSLLRGGGRSGTGLGLTIASGIIVEEGGTLTFTRRETSPGSIFTVALPRRSKA